ncbi:transporter (CPA2 family) [Tamilnaduibacter salinus]|uniref:Transporter (CPA2 family) n=1 Tax=Tamilnaduibacter salinus TaxID=1484056 RepID=A0A2U1CX74_9GAMM|nr:cation:proton antiporter family protein [Tamilnaduibacter salinus]PVY76491.1 transporter (CPA2 family) [Tamilnaduibacter salinus]
MTEAIWILFAFSLGLAARTLALPPLVGFLVAGFLLNASGQALGLPAGSTAILDHLAHLGVLLLLFTVGLKLKLKALLRPEVIGGGLLHFGLTVAVVAPGLLLLMDLGTREAVLLAIALSFSSTVLVAKVLESKNELRAFHGRVAIGILVVQDLIALVVMSVTAGHTPSAWALLVFALPLLRPLLFRLLDISGHDELLVLLGMLLALAVGGMGFEAMGLSSELGALLIGALLANHPRAQELSKSLWSVKEIFLVGFFLQIGMEGLPDQTTLLFAMGAALLLPLKGVLFFLLMIAFRLRARSSFLTSLSLSNYSEFGLIVASVALPEWLVPLAITVALSFVISAPLNRLSHNLHGRFGRHLARFERHQRHPDEQPLSLGDTEVLVMGMGRTGTAAYDRLIDTEPRLMAIDSDPSKVDKHINEGRNVVFADAEDDSFWQGLYMPNLKSVVLAMSEIEGKLLAARMLRKKGFTGYIVAHTMYADEAVKIQEAGVNAAYLTMNETGVALASHITDLAGRQPDAS